ncbi:MAG: hypothetical protein MPJ50_16610 [Pirellulales bacterium]|nr:hypothetical protein [Pirellulales bacterium]
MRNPQTQPRHAAPSHDLHGPFAEMAYEANSVLPAFSAELHDQLMGQIAELQPSDTKPAAAYRNSFRQPTRENRDLRPARWSALSFFLGLGACTAVAASLALFFVAWWSWVPEQESPLPAQVVTADRGFAVRRSHESAVPQDMNRNSPTSRENSSQARARRDHEDLTAVINYFLTLGNRSPRLQPQSPQQTSLAGIDKTPWLRPSISPDTLVFEIDQQHLAQLAATFLALE